MTTRILVLLACLTILPTASNAALMSAQDLVTACSGDGTAKARCDGYLMAVTDALLLRESRGHTGKICVPDSVTVDQVRDAVNNISGRPRAERAPDAVVLVMMAMRVTWPCNQAPKSQ